MSPGRASWWHGAPWGGTIESHGCNTRKLTPAAHCGSATIPRYRTTFYVPPPWTSVILAISEADYVTSRSASDFAFRGTTVSKAPNADTRGKKGKINITPAAFHGDSRSADQGQRRRLNPREMKFPDDRARSLAVPYRWNSRNYIDGRGSM